MKFAIEELQTSGQIIGALDGQKQAFSDRQSYAEAKDKKFQLDGLREKIYKELKISELLALPLPKTKPTSPKDGVLPPPTRLKSQIGRSRSPTRRSESPVQVESLARKALPPPIDRRAVQAVTSPRILNKRLRQNSEELEEV